MTPSNVRIAGMQLQKQVQLVVIIVRAVCTVYTLTLTRAIVLQTAVANSSPLPIQLEKIREQ